MSLAVFLTVPCVAGNGFDHSMTLVQKSHQSMMIVCSYYDQHGTEHGHCMTDHVTNFGKRRFYL